eukprot:CAMPEP_0184696360 /NCGR_PEP_ID=MMETSP0313-20130426/3688_1 /TAXON_ID=2792 /ORGANISM="Porphyridium aerugineum, Strain SAG 1380-2" /LENGTH=369 /DNA_ID=CAMNT_0027154979 /DNA_START=313 /DNA_END=1422 /DNA_ORIENTATION=-
MTKKRTRELDSAVPHQQEVQDEAQAPPGTAMETAILESETIKQDLETAGGQAIVVEIIKHTVQSTGHVLKHEEKGDQTDDQPQTQREPEGKRLLAQGAEGRVYVTSFLNSRHAVVKVRFSKKYRHPELDTRLTSKRISQEVRMMVRARKLGIRTPVLYDVKKDCGEIWMEYLEEQHGWRSLKSMLFDFEHNDFKEYLDSNVQESGQRTHHNITGTGSAALVLALKKNRGLMAMASLVGAKVAELHRGDIIHGDLTTSNIMIQKINNTESSKLSEFELAFIDFGLSTISTMDEDRAVDLYVLERAIESAHSLFADIFNEQIIDSYREAYKNSKDGSKRSADANSSITPGFRVIRKLEDVRMRGRKRVMIG